MKIHRLRVCLFDNPFGLGDRLPDLSWELTGPSDGHSRQSAYRVIVASSAQDAESGRADLWDSGWVESGQTAFVRYAGRPMESPLASWVTGLLDEEDWSAKWIGLDAPAEFPEDPLPGVRWIWDGTPEPGVVVFEKDFLLSTSESGLLWGLADDEAEVEINGAPVCQLPRAQGDSNLFPLP